MKKLLPAFWICFVFILITSCGPAAREKEGKSAPSGNTSDQANTTSEMAVASPAETNDQSGAMSSSAAIEKGSDSSRKFIRTAELRFRVHDVIKTTYRIEDITKLNGGFVELSNLASTVDNEENKSLTADSTLIITHYTLNNNLTLRVPNTALDTTLKQLAPLIEFLDYRVIKVKDVALDLLSNRLTQSRAQKHDERLTSAINNKANKTSDITSAAESLLNSQEKADQALISELTLKDQIKFSTISVQLYQRQSVKYNIVPNEKNIKVYEPGFGRKAIEALQIGFNVFIAFILFLLEIWWLILLAVLTYFLYPKIRRKKLPLK